jgi:hypothetical protein
MAYLKYLHIKKENELYYNVGRNPRNIYCLNHLYKNSSQLLDVYKENIIPIDIQLHKISFKVIFTMNDRQRNSSSSSSDDLSTNSKQSTGLPSSTSSKQGDSHYFHIRCLSKKKTLKGIKYTSLDDIKNDAYQLYKDGGFNDDNAILTYLNESKVEVLLTSVPDLPKKGHPKDLFIRFVCILLLNKYIKFIYF